MGDHDNSLSLRTPRRCRKRTRPRHRFLSFILHNDKKAMSQETGKEPMLTPTTPNISSSSCSPRTQKQPHSDQGSNDYPSLNIPPPKTLKLPTSIQKSQELTPGSAESTTGQNTVRPRSSSSSPSLPSMESRTDDSAHPRKSCLLPRLWFAKLSKDS